MTTTSTSWPTRRLATAALVLLFASYVVVFVATGTTPSVNLALDAAANVVAALAAGLPVVWLCRRVPWRTASRWWFLPLHVFGALAFALLWDTAIAWALGVRSGITGGSWAPMYLTGPARSWLSFTASILYFAIAGGCYAVQAAESARQAAVLQHDAEMSAMRAQLDPHLLFNTLHSLLELVRSGDARAEEAIDRFARVTRYVAAGRDAGSTVPLAAEWAMLEDYLALESLRLGARLRITRVLHGDATGAALPALTLQPLVENAIRHGIAPRAGPGHLEVTATIASDRIELVVEDDGLGAAATTAGQGTGLALVRRRLAAQYGPRLQFAAGPRPSGGWRVHTVLPRNA